MIHHVSSLLLDCNKVISKFMIFMVFTNSYITCRSMNIVTPFYILYSLKDSPSCPNWAKINPKLKWKFMVRRGLSQTSLVQHLRVCNYLKTYIQACQKTFTWLDLYQWYFVLKSGNALRAKLWVGIQELLLCGNVF